MDAVDAQCFAYTRRGVVSRSGTHYLAHTLNLKIRRIGVNWRGPYVVREQGSAVQNLAVSMAGPLVNLVLAGAMVLGPWLGTAIVIFGLYNLLVGLYNLLPVPFSDGRRILTLLCKEASLNKALNGTAIAALPNS